MSRQDSDRVLTRQELAELEDSTMNVESPPVDAPAAPTVDAPIDVTALVDTLLAPLPHSKVEPAVRTFVQQMGGMPQVLRLLRDMQHAITQEMAEMLEEKAHAQDEKDDSDIMAARRVRPLRERNEPNDPRELAREEADPAHSSTVVVTNAIASKVFSTKFACDLLRTQESIDVLKLSLATDPDFIALILLKALDSLIEFDMAELKHAAPSAESDIGIPIEIYPFILLCIRREATEVATSASALLTHDSKLRLKAASLTTDKKLMLSLLVQSLRMYTPPAWKVLSYQFKSFNDLSNMLAEYENNAIVLAEASVGQAISPSEADTAFTFVEKCVKAIFPLPTLGFVLQDLQTCDSIASLLRFDADSIIARAVAPYSDTPETLFPPHLDNALPEALSILTDVETYMLRVCDLSVELMQVSLIHAIAYEMSGYLNLLSVLAQPSRERNGASYLPGWEPSALTSIAAMHVIRGMMSSALGACVVASSGLLARFVQQLKDGTMTCPRGELEDEGEDLDDEGSIIRYFKIMPSVVNESLRSVSASLDALSDVVRNVADDAQPIDLLHSPVPSAFISGATQLDVLSAVARTFSKDFLSLLLAPTARDCLLGPHKANDPAAFDSLACLLSDFAALPSLAESAHDVITALAASDDTSFCEMLLQYSAATSAWEVKVPFSKHRGETTPQQTGSGCPIYDLAKQCYEYDDETRARALHRLAYVIAQPPASNSPSDHLSAAAERGRAMLFSLFSSPTMLSPQAFGQVLQSVADARAGKAPAQHVIASRNRATLLAVEHFQRVANSILDELQFAALHMLESGSRHVWFRLVVLPATSVAAAMEATEKAESFLRFVAVATPTTSTGEETRKLNYDWRQRIARNLVFGHKDFRKVDIRVPNSGGDETSGDDEKKRGTKSAASYELVTEEFSKSLGHVSSVLRTQLYTMSKASGMLPPFDRPAVTVAADVG